VPLHRRSCLCWKACLPIFEQAGLLCRSRGLDARARRELAQDRRDVVIHRAARDDELLGHLGVPQPARHKPQNLDLADRQVGRIGARRGARTARPGVNAGRQTAMYSQSASVE
jgi:hypothetical protein